MDGAAAGMAAGAPAKGAIPDMAVRAVSHTFAGKGEGVQALADITIELMPGRFVGLVGPSGCGKSSLLSMLAGLLRPTQGRIELRGRELTGPEPKEIGVIFQEASLLPWKTAIENIEFPLKLRGVPAAERRQRATEWLQLVGLADFAHHLPRELSGGMRQRVSIARGFCQDPGVLLMDEPFAALDEQTRMTMGDELLKIWDQRKKTVLFVTHSLTEAVYLCDEVLIMSHRPGRIIDRVEIPLGRPRTYDMMATETFGKLRDRMWRAIRKP